ncbi:hypothetical protein [Amycolatopsis sp. lyj-109]|uniref:hypothetical protein n=1 Tax=Amycolatopsis sp. lyj-109 TaxID=2789287 RepID=UPI00397DC7FD
MRDSKRIRSTWTDAEHWKFSVERRDCSERTLNLTLRFALRVYARTKWGKGFFNLEARYPELLTLAEFGFSHEMILAAHERALRSSNGATVVLFTTILAPVVTLGTLVSLLSPNDTTSTWLFLAIIAALICFMFTVNSALTEQGTGDEARVFDATIAAMATLHDLRKVCLLHFSASLSGKRKIIQMHKNGRKNLRTQARVFLIYCPKLTVLDSSDEEYFKCIRIAAWILHSAKNFRNVESLNKSFKACGEMIEHLLQGRPWEIADITPAPEDIDILPPTFTDRAKNYLLNILRPVNLSVGVGIAATVVAIFRK